MQSKSHCAPDPNCCTMLTLTGSEQEFAQSHTMMVAPPESSGLIPVCEACQALVGQQTPPIHYPETSWDAFRGQGALQTSNDRP